MHEIQLRVTGGGLVRASRHLPRPQKRGTPSASSGQARAPSAWLKTILGTGPTRRISHRIQHLIGIAAFPARSTVSPACKVHSIPIHPPR